MAGKRRDELHEGRAARYRAGAGVREIAAEDGASVYVVRRSLKLAGAIPTKETRARRAYFLRAHGLKWSRIAEDMGATSDKALVSTVRRWAQARGLPWPEASLEALKRWEKEHG